MTLGTLGSSMAFDNVCLLKYVIKLLCYQRKLFQQFSQLDFSVPPCFTHYQIVHLPENVCQQFYWIVITICHSLEEEDSPVLVEPVKASS